jgi:hypothetical protein
MDIFITAKIEERTSEYLAKIVRHVCIRDGP